MPNKAPHKCSTSGCTNLSTRGKCEGCKANAKYRRVALVDNRLTNISGHDAAKRIAAWKQSRPELLEASRLRGNRNYQRLRTWLKAVHPRCYNPIGRHRGHPPMAQQVHHIVSVVKAADMAFDATNCVPLCASCHARVEAAERNGRLDAATWNRWREFIGEVIV